MSTALKHGAPLDFSYDAGRSPVLGCVRFGSATSTPTGLCIQPGLHPLQSSTPAIEYINAQGPLHAGHHGAIRHASDGTHLLAVLELRVDAYGGLEACADHAYRTLHTFNQHSGYPQVLRMWNYMDHINHGMGDAESYRRFCLGRARGLSSLSGAQYPAASAIGRQQANGLLTVYWLAARQAGMTLENPRQMSAYHYPRDYGPASPSFARACLTAEGVLLISGTASIVGHATQHANDVIAQTHETLNNLDALIVHARQRHPDLPAVLDKGSLLKVYVRHAEHAALIQQVIDQRCGTQVSRLLLNADICRRDLLLEIDCVHGLSAPGDRD